MNVNRVVSLGVINRIGVHVSFEDRPRGEVEGNEMRVWYAYKCLSVLTLYGPSLYYYCPHISGSTVRHCVKIPGIAVGVV